MDAEQIRKLRPRLRKFLKEFDAVFPRKDSRAHVPVYVEGQLSELKRKSVEPIADRARVPPRSLQNFLAVHQWRADDLDDRIARRVVAKHAHDDAVLVIDETSDDKKGDKTPGVARQYLGCRGKVENGIVTVHLAFAAPDFHGVLSGDLFLPEAWANDRPRCRAAGIPDEVGHRTKKQIALDLLDAALARGVRASWITFDEGYGNSPEFLRQVDQRGLRYVAEVPKSYVGWTRFPELATPRRRGRARPAPPRLAPTAAPARRVEQLLEGPELRVQPWRPYRIKDGEKGPLVWEAKNCDFYSKDVDGLPSRTQQLVVARNPLDGEVKYFVTNDPEAPTTEVLRAAFSRWVVEHCFKDGKQEVGFLHFEGRNYAGLRRHLALAALSYLFLQEVRKDERKKKSGADRVPSPRGGGPANALVEPGPGAAAGAGAEHRGAAGRAAGAEREGAAEPPQGHASEILGARHSNVGLPGLPLALGARRSAARRARPPSPRHT